MIPQTYPEADMQPAAIWTRFAAALLGCLLSIDVRAASPLPVPCVPCTPTSGGAPVTFGGLATVSGNNMTVTAGTTAQPNVTLNWQSFNIAAGSSVKFVQPSSTAIALNEIYQANPSTIFGNLTANGQIYLINPNGIIFGDPSGTPVQVSTHGLVASSLQISPYAIANGILAPLQQDTAAFSGTTGFIQVNSGAVLSTDSGGRVALFAPTVQNSGQISTPNGQAILAAGQKVYLQASDDPNLRGLIVEVDDGGSVTNAGTIQATTGNISLLGLAVNQQGRVNATTSITEAGSIYLLAEDNQTFEITGGVHSAVPQSTGTVTLGPKSVTEVSLDTSGASAVDDQPQPQSQITIAGQSIQLLGGSQVIAPGSVVSLTAESDPSVTTVQPNNPAVSIEMDPGSSIDVSGGNATVPMSRNQITAQLRGNELADSPLQRNGILDGQTVYIDARVGTPLANISGYIDSETLRTVDERLGHGGTVQITSDGSVTLAAGSTINVSGGVVNYTPGYITTTELESNGQIYDIGSAPENIVYDAIVGAASTNATKWGVFTTSATLQPTYYPGYVQGQSAGTIDIAGRTLTLGATLMGTTTIGPYQRSAADVPDGGTLIIGQPSGANASGFRDYDAPSLLVSGAEAASGSGAALVPISTYAADGFTEFKLYSDGSITVPAGSPVTIAPGGTLAFTGQQVVVDSNLAATGGTIALTGAVLDPSVQLLSSAGVIIGDDVHLSVAGGWVNDFEVLQPTTPLFINGGQLSLASDAVGGQLILGRNTLLDAESGAWANGGGALTGGNGGTISLTSAAIESTLAIGAGTELRGFGVAEGGTLSIFAPAVTISGTGDASGTTSLVLEGTSTATTSGALSLPAGIFAQGGFAQYNIGAATGNLLVDGTAAVNVVAASRVLVPGYMLQPTGADIDTFSNIQYLPQYERSPASIALAVNLTDPLSFPGTLQVQSGATITTDPQGSISLMSSGGGLYLDGHLSAPAGTVTIASSQSGSQDFDPTFATWLGPNAVIDVSGTIIRTPEAAGTTAVQVLGGGTASISSSGYLVTQSGSQLIADGASTLVDIVSGSTNDQWLDRPGSDTTLVGSAAGALSLAAGEGMILDGGMRAAAGTPAYFGGSLTVDLSRSLRTGDPTGVPAYPLTGTTIEITQSVTPLLPSGAVFGDALSTSTYDGSALLSVAQLAASRIDSLDLRSDNTIAFVGSTPISLELARTLTLDAPDIAAASGASSINISVPSLVLKSLVTSTTPAAAAGTATLTASAADIDVSGWVDLSGFSTAALLSSGDIRLLGPDGVGALAAGDVLTLQANQIYPESMTSFSITAGTTGSGGVINVATNGTSSAGEILSVGGRLTLTADTINQNGVLEAPIGSIVLNAADSLNLGPNSITTVHLSAPDVLLGSTINQTDWYYSFAGATGIDSSDQIFGANTQAFPSKQITLNGRSVVMSKGAVVNVSGGGDIEAYEQIPGTGGTTDVLDLQNSNGMFAVIPTQGGYGPIDPSEFAGWTAAPGAAITLLQGANGLPAGTYAILPPRYALLPGAFLIIPTSGYSNMSASATVALQDGGVVVPGFDSMVGSGLQAGAVAGFSVHPGSYAEQLAQYAITSADTYLATRAGQLALPTPQLPIDAGVLNISGQGGLQLNGTFVSAPAPGGQGAQVNITAPNIAVVATLDGNPALTEVTASALDNLGAASILIGGTRSSEGQLGTELTALASSVSVAPGASISVPELILLGTNSVDIASGASITTSGSSGTATAPYLLNGDSAFALFSSQNGASLVRTYASGATPGQTGTVTVAQGTSLSASGSLILDGAENLQVGSTLNVPDGGTVALSSSSISLGQGVAGTGLLLTSAQLAALQGVNLTLTSRGPITFLSPLTVQANNLTLDAPVLQSALGDPATAVSLVTHGTLTLQDSSVESGSGGALGPTSGTLSAQAGSIIFNNGAVAVDGFTNVGMDASSMIVGKGTATLTFQGSLSATAPLITVADGGNLTLASADGTGTLSFAARGVATTSPYLGGVFNAQANIIEQDGRISVPSGAIDLVASNGIELGSDSYTGAPGAVVSFPNYTAYSPAGTVTLTSSAGDIRLDAGAAVDVSAPSAGGDAGAVVLTAANGNLYLDPSASLLGSSAGGSLLAGSFTALAAGLTGADINTLNAMLNSGGFAGSRSFRLYGPNTTVDLTAGTSIDASSFQLIVDQGTVNVAGAINASNPNGMALVSIAASGDITLASTGSITASSAATGTTEAEVSLSSVSGDIEVGSGALITTSAPNATGSLGGSLIEYTLSRSALAANGFLNNGTIQSPEQIVVGNQAYSVSSGIVSSQVNASAANPIYAAATQFMASAPVKSLIGEGYVVEPGIELDSPGDMQINSTWNLAAWRFGGVPGVLTLRAGGSLDVNASISDGFASADPTAQLLTGRSWDLNLVAGADFSSADPLQVIAGSTGSVVFGPDTLVRSGTGNIAVRAAQDIMLTGSINPGDPYAQAVVYTAGRDGGFDLDALVNPHDPSDYVPVDGGSLSLTAGRDIVGLPSDFEFFQLYTEWFERQPAQFREPAGIYIDYAPFQQNFAAFGGGDLTMTAGQDIVRVGASVPTTASYNATTQTATYYGQGSLTVTAGGDIDSGQFFVGDGAGRIRAGGSLTDTSQGPFGGATIGTVLAAMNSNFSVVSRGDLNLETVLNPTLVGQISPSFLQSTYFVSYSPTASVSLTSIAGQVNLQNSAYLLLQADYNYGQISQLEPADLQIYPGTLIAAAYRGDINIQGNMYLAPTAQADLVLAAHGNITSPGNDFDESDLSLAVVPTLANPYLGETPTFLSQIYADTGSLAHADPPLHASDPLQADIIAATGDITGGFWEITQQAFVFAGQDLTDVRLNLQNELPSQTTDVFAGRDITFTGANTNLGINIDGPGNLNVVAGRNIDLGPDFGIVSDGNLVNLGLPASGANITVMAGISSDLGSSLAQVPTDAQVVNLFDTLVTTGRAAVAGQGNFDPGYAAIAALFPTTPGVAGNLSMIYSRIYTLDGGDINIVVPNGSVDVGAAQASSTTGVQKPPYELGIVTEEAGSVRALTDGDFLVDSSRVFTLGGGNIVIWSSNGSIDAGRGAKTTISAPPPIVTIDPEGNVTQDFSAAISGSGIRGILTASGVPPGDVDLYAPRGEVIAGDAGIGSAGNITIGALAVVGASNINFGGTAAGVPVETGGLGASLAGVSAAASGASNSVSQPVEAAAGAQQQQPGQAAASWLDVFVVGLGAENCAPSDMECLKRQPH